MPAFLADGGCKQGAPGLGRVGDEGAGLEVRYAVYQSHLITAAYPFVTCCRYTTLAQLEEALKSKKALLENGRAAGRGGGVGAREDAGGGGD